MSTSMALRKIGVVHSPFKEAPGAPIQPRTADGAAGTVELDEQYSPALKDLEGFERIWLIYWFHRSPGPKLQVQPFLDKAERGLFACRAPCRPNPIGISAVRLVKVEGSRLHVEDVDILDGTPLLDIKPYVPKFDSYPEARSGWLEQADLRRRAKADDRFAQDQTQ